MSELHTEKRLECLSYSTMKVLYYENIERMPLPSLQDDALVAYQIAFDLYESATQHFLRRVQEEIQASLPSPPPPSTPSHNQGGDKLSVPVQETGGGEKSVEWGGDGRETPSVPVQETGAGGRGEQRKGERRKGGRSREV